MALGVLVMFLISYALGHRRMLWEDEMLGWMLLTDPSFAHMVAAWRMGADGGGFSFYLSCREWFHLFGATEVSFRFYSASCFALSFVCVWITARRFYSTWIVAFALFNTYFGSPPIVLHLVEGRFYGLLMLAVSFVSLLIMKGAQAAKHLSWGHYALMFFANGLLTTSHILGIVYSILLTMMMMGIDRMSGRFRPGIYASAALSWLLVLPELPAIRASMQVGKPWFWVPQPTLARVMGVIPAFSGEISVVLLILAFGIMVSWRRQGVDSGLMLIRAIAERRDSYALILFLFLVPVTFVLVGLIGPPIFINRYLIPVAIATAFLTAEQLALINVQAREPFARAKYLRPLAFLVLAAVLPAWILIRVPQQIMANYDYTRQLDRVLPRDRPVLLEDAWSFTEIIGASPSNGPRFLYPLDWSECTAPTAPRLEVTQYNLMKNWQRAGYFSDSIVDLNKFLNSTRTFIVLDDDGPTSAVPRVIGNPLALRFAHAPGYQIKRYAVIPKNGGSVTAWLVEHDPTPGVALPPLTER